VVQSLFVDFVRGSWICVVKRMCLSAVCPVCAQYDATVVWNICSGRSRQWRPLQPLRDLAARSQMND